MDTQKRTAFCGNNDEEKETHNGTLLNCLYALSHSECFKIERLNVEVQVKNVERWCTALEHHNLTPSDDIAQE
ncbi:CLUMA_CG020814, isoform A [Clunio marinus]|uniref:CLUMA_CG020814, isoform A n=1 Tax=Clunio marinus TaxID=568069 RepID=A0A1J1J7W2_9DIPT|nr:CLUMA_CG020814, isoform A [Clunio marinus]